MIVVKGGEDGGPSCVTDLLRFQQCCAIVFRLVRRRFCGRAPCQ